MEYKDFKALEGKTLLIQAAAGDLEVRLATVDSLGDGIGQHRKPFSLLLEAPKENFLEQGMYPVARPAVTRWVWLGIFASVKVSASVPPVSPKRLLVSPGPVPGCIGARP